MSIQQTQGSRPNCACLERAAGFEPATTCLGSKDSTTELRPLDRNLPESYAGTGLKSRNEEMLSLQFNNCEFSPADLQPIGLAGHRRENGVCIGLFLFVDFETALDDQSAGFALTGDQSGLGHKIGKTDALPVLQIG